MKGNSYSCVSQSHEASEQTKRNDGNAIEKAARFSVKADNLAKVPISVETVNPGGTRENIRQHSLLKIKRAKSDTNLSNVDVNSANYEEIAYGNLLTPSTMVMQKDPNLQDPVQNDDALKNIDHEKYERRLSFFNFNVFKRSSSETSELKRHGAIKGLIKFVGNREERNSTSCKTRCELNRSKSLTDVSDTTYNEDDDVLVNGSLQRTVLPLFRVQSFKMHVQNKTFRPNDVSYGEVIGKGFFGDVIKICDKSTGEEMVMKSLTNLEEDALNNFMQEVTLLKSLRHPNVMKFIGVMYKDKAVHIVAEYVAGGTLRKLLKNLSIELSWTQRINFAKDISSGMTYLHSMGVIHRDLKSPNVLIKTEENCKMAVVADFGLARVLEKRADRLNNVNYKDKEKTCSQAPVSPRTPNRKRMTVVGTAYWMAPEMMKGKPYNEKCDVFSFGIVLCEIIGRVKADPDYLPRTKHFGLDIESFKDQFCSGCPEAFFQLAVACCDLDPDQRPSFMNCNKWLESILAHLEFSVPISDHIDFTLPPKPLRLESIEYNSRR